MSSFGLAIRLRLKALLSLLIPSAARRNASATSSFAPALTTIRLIRWQKLPSIPAPDPLDGEAQLS